MRGEKMAYYHGNKKSRNYFLWNSADMGSVVKHWAVVIGVCDINKGMRKRSERGGW